MEDDVKTFADYIAMLRRRKRLLLIVFVVISLAGVYVTYSLEPVYVSTATFRVQQPTVSNEEIGQNAGAGSVDEQIQLARQAVMSVDYLAGVIDEFGLYPGTTQGFAASRDAVEKLRNSIDVETEYTDVVNQRTGRETLMSIGFIVGVRYSDPLKAQLVATEIANRFLVENRRSRSEKVEETIAFIERDLEASDLEVERSTAALAEFRESNSGNLPELSGFNLQSIQRTERAIEDLDAAIRAARDQIFELESELADPNLLATVYDENGEPVAGTAQRLAELRRERLRLVSIYSEQHPDVVSIEREISILESDLSVNRASATELSRQLEAARTELTLARQRYADDHPDVRRLSRAVDSLQLQLREAGDRPSQNVLVASQDPVVRQLQLRIEAQEADIASFQARRAEQVARIAEYERKQMQLPQIERELLRLTRDSEAAIARNTELREQLVEARTTGKLESESGTIFILTDPPRLPVQPFEPNRQSLLILTVVAALLVGVMGAIAVDSMDKTVKDSQDVFRMLGAPPLAVIPYLETTSDRRRRIAAGMAMSGFVLGAAALAVFIAQSAA